MKDSIKKIIKTVLEKLDVVGIKYSEEAMALVFETGNTETGYRHLEQIKGPAIGFFQFEPWVVKDTMDNYLAYRPKTNNILIELGFDQENYEFSVLTNIAVQVALCRIHYRRKPGSIPKLIEGRAKYWKKHYNTELGKGTVEHYLKANK